jgi:hypothetical protein
VPAPLANLPRCNPDGKPSVCRGFWPTPGQEGPQGAAVSLTGSGRWPASPSLHGKELEHWLQRNFGRADQAKVQPTSDEVAAVFVTLAVLGSLRLRAPRDLFADLARVPRDHINEAVTCLEASNLITTTLSLLPGAAYSAEAPCAPVAYYTSNQTIGLRHPGYGRLVLEWLASANDTGHHTLLAAGGLAILEAKIGRAVYQMWRKQQPFDVKKFLTH